MMRPTYLKGDHTKGAAFNNQSRLVYGTAAIGGVWGPVAESESIDALLYALENGVFVLDTAPSYADAELFVGKALKQWKGPTPFVSTKIGRLRAEDAFETKLDYSREGMKRSLHHSLEILGLDAIDLLFLHEPQVVPIDKIHDIIETLHLFKQQGLVKSLGIGGNPPEALMPFITKDNFEVVSGFLRMDASDLSVFNGEIQHYQQAKIKYYAASPLHFGLLGNRYEEFKKDGADGKWITLQQLEHATKVKAIAHEINMPFATLCQRYLFSIAEADRIVIGARNTTQIKASIADWNLGQLPEPLFNRITDVIMK